MLILRLPKRLVSGLIFFISSPSNQTSNISKKPPSPEKKNIKSSNNSTNHSHRNTLSDYVSDKKNFNNNNKNNYYSNYNLSNSIKFSTERANLRKRYNKSKILKKMLKIFGKEIYTPINSKPNEKIIKNIKILNILSDNGFKLPKTSFKKNKD